VTAWSCETPVTKPPRKQRLSVYLDPSVMNRLADHAARRDHSRSLVAEAAIESFLSPDAAERQEAVITKRLDQLDRRMSRMVRFWVTTTPSLPEPAAQAARAKAGERYDQFVTALGRRLAKGPKLHQEISEDVDGEAE